MNQFNIYEWWLPKMQNSFPYIDILIFGIIAVFLIFRLKNILGTKTDIDDNNINEKLTNKSVTNVVPIKGKEDKIYSNDIKKIIEADPQFNIENFLSGSRTFFEMVLNSFVSGNLDEIKDYTKPSVLKSFKNAIDERIKEKETLIIELKAIKKNEILSTNVNKTSIKINVLFETSQVRALMDKDKKLIDGDNESEILVNDEWVFERKINSENLNWILIETKSS